VQRKLCSRIGHPVAAGPQPRTILLDCLTLTHGSGPRAGELRVILRRGEQRRRREDVTARQDNRFMYRGKEILLDYVDRERKIALRQLRRDSLADATDETLNNWVRIAVVQPRSCAAIFLPISSPAAAKVRAAKVSTETTVAATRRIRIRSFPYGFAT
jgi:hypothetical protein